MKKFYTALLASFLIYPALAVGSFQTDKGELGFAKPIPPIELKRGEVHAYTVKLTQGSRYVFSVYQNGIDLVVKLLDNKGTQLAEKDSPNGTKGFEKLAYKAPATGEYKLQITALDDTSNTEAGRYEAYAAEQKGDLVAKLETENKKLIQTLDIDHFWEAFDNLKNCRTRRDSILSFQTLYIDRATEGLEDFMSVRNFTAPEYFRAVKQFPKFYASVRATTYEAKKTAAIVQEVFDKFSKLYPNFKPFKVNFAIGTLMTGGTVTDKYVLIGTELTTASEVNDLSEMGNSGLGRLLNRKASVEQLIKNMVAHESVHIQQSNKKPSNAPKCNLLAAASFEGICDFIGEKIAGSQINVGAHEYGNKHEKELAAAFLADPCDGKVSDWLYNFSSVKDDVPADLGYYMGYKIAESYYNLQTDKKQAIVDIIEMNNPKEFLEKSKYAEKFR